MAFATPEDVATRLGRELDPVEAGTVELLLDGAASLIAQAVDKPDAWVAAVSPVPSLLRIVTIEAVARVFLNPAGATQASEQLGSYSTSQAFPRDTVGLSLTAGEERLVRLRVFGTLSGSSTPRALPDRLIDLNEGRDVDETE